MAAVNPITQQIQSTYDGSAVQQATSDLNAMAQAGQQVNSTSGIGGLGAAFANIEGPLSHIGFHTLAADLGATGVAGRELTTVFAGLGETLAGPIVLGIGAAALAWEAYTKYQESAANAPSPSVQASKDATNAIDTVTKLKDELEKLQEDSSIPPEITNAIQAAIGGNTAKAIEYLNSISAQVKNYSEDLKELDDITRRLNESEHSQNILNNIGLVILQEQQTQLKQRIADTGIDTTTLEAYLHVKEEVNALQREGTSLTIKEIKDAEDITAGTEDLTKGLTENSKALKKWQEGLGEEPGFAKHMSEELYELNRDLNAANEDIQESSEKIKAIREAAGNDALTKDQQIQIKLLTNQKDADNKFLQEATHLSDQLQQIQKKQVTETVQNWERYSEMTSESFGDILTGQKTFNQAMEALGGELLKSIGQQISKSLEASAVAAGIGQPPLIPPDPALAAALGVAAGVVQGITGAAAGALTSASNANSSSSTSSNTAGGGSSTAASNPYSFYINVQGGIVDPGTAQNIINAINTQVQNNGGQLSASNVFNGSNPIPVA